MPPRGRPPASASSSSSSATTTTNSDPSSSTSSSTSTSTFTSSIKDSRDIKDIKMNPTTSSSSSTPFTSISSSIPSTISTNPNEPLDKNMRLGKRKALAAFDKKKRKKTIPRCASPSHFLVDNTELASYGPAYTHKNPDRARVDTLFTAVSSLFYRPRSPHANGQDVYVSSEYDKYEYPTLDLLISPLRKTNVLDTWSPLEMALFESGMCSCGKDFHAIQKIVKTKTTSEVVDFYYNWKKSSHYQMWKEYGKPNKKFHSGKEEQWTAIQAKMESHPPNGIIKPEVKKEITETTTPATTATSTAVPTTTTTTSTAS